MHTQCPDCKTKFLVNDDQLRVAQGKVRCSKCHKVFNAIESMQTPPQTASAQVNDQPPPTLPDTVTDFMSETDLHEFSELKAKVSDDLSPKKKSENKSGEQPPKQEQKIDDDLSEVLKELERLENNSSENSAPEKPNESTEPSPSELEQEAQPATPTLNDPMELLSPKKPAKKSSGLLWSIVILMLLTAALAQLAWYKREQLMHYPEGRLLLQTACKYAGCTLPTIRDPEKIQVLSRSIAMHPKIDNALLIQLTIANKASFPQPQPLLQISLFSSDERLVVQRRFKPSEYLADKAKPGLLLPGKAMYVELAIEDPGDDVTGFKLDFF